MKQSKERKPVSLASLPYLKLLSELKSDTPKIQLAPVIEFFLNHSKVNAPLVYIRNYVDQLKVSFKEKLSSRKYRDLVLIAQTLGLKIIGSPGEGIRSIDRAFIGCQTNSTGGNIIYLAQGISKSWARATIAHEIIHLAFSSKKLGRPGNLKTDFIEEVLCDYGAARLLIDDSVIFDELSREKYGENETYKNVAERINYLASFFNVPRNYICYRIFDVFAQNNLQDIAAIIEWKAETNYAVGGDDNKIQSNFASPVFSISQNSFIPHKKGFSCRPRISSIIFKAFYEELSFDDSENGSNNFFSGSAEEYVSIGTLKGYYKVIVCGIGKIGTSHRVVISVFIPS